MKEFYKLKDGIDIKQLEEFGFYKLNESDMHPYVYDVEPEDEESDFSYKGFGMLEVDEFDMNGNKDRTLHFYTTTDDEVWWNLTILFDLIQAGILEKGGKNENEV